MPRARALDAGVYGAAANRPAPHFFFSILLFDHIAPSHGRDYYFLFRIFSITDQGAHSATFLRTMYWLCTLYVHIPRAHTCSNWRRERNWLGRTINICLFAQCTAVIANVPRCCTLLVYAKLKRAYKYTSSSPSDENWARAHSNPFIGQNARRCEINIE